MEQKVEFPKEVFDEYLYNARLSQLKAEEDAFFSAVDAIKEEEVSIPLDKLREIAGDEEAFAAFFRDMRDHCVRSLGFVPKREKLRIQAVYQELADAIYPHVARIKKAFDAGLMAEEKGGKMVINHKEQERVAREACTTRVDAALMSEYWWRLSLVVAAIEGARQWEQEHGLPVFAGVEHRSYFTRKVGASVFPAEVSFVDFLKRPDKDLFFQMMAGKMPAKDSDKGVGL